MDDDGARAFDPMKWGPFSGNHGMRARGTRVMLQVSRYGWSIKVTVSTSRWLLPNGIGVVTLLLVVAGKTVTLAATPDTQPRRHTWSRCSAGMRSQPATLRGRWWARRGLGPGVPVADGAPGW